MNELALELLEKAKYIVNLPQFKTGVCGHFVFANMEITYSEYYDSVSIFNGIIEVFKANGDNVSVFNDGEWIHTLNECYRKLYKNNVSINPTIEGGK